MRLLQAIREENLDFIFKPISVEYDNRIGAPVVFHHKNGIHRIAQVMYRLSWGKCIGFLARTVAQEYCFIYLEMFGSQEEFFRKGRWVLWFWIRPDKAHKLWEEGSVLVNMELKRIADFHGHLCPELAIGYRAAKLALSHLAIPDTPASDLRVVAENSTSALDAIQFLTGCTTGNGRLVHKNYGKHVYTFLLPGKLRSLRLSLRKGVVNIPDQFLLLEEKIRSHEADIFEVAQYETILGGLVDEILSLANEALFNIEQILVKKVENEKDESLRLDICERCGEPVIASRIVDVKGFRLCKPCSIPRAGQQTCEKGVTSV
jgi:formylmethanofuran dehydrogenase subunit E